MRKHKVAAVVTALAVAASGCGGGGLKKKPPALSGETTTLNLGLPQQALDAPVTGDVPADQILHVNVVLKVSDATLNQLGAKFKSASPSSGDLAKKIGVSDADLKKLEDYFAGGNIQVKSSKTKTAVSFDAKAGVVAQLMQTKFVDHKLNGRTYYTPDPAHMPKVPKEVAGYILAVTGLDDYSTPMTKGGAPAIAQTPATFKAASGCPNFATHPEAATAAKVASSYGVSRFWQQGWHGEGMTVNLIEMDGYNPQDVQGYLACTGSHIQLQNVDLGSPPKAEGETNLDIAMIAGLAPGVKVVDYQQDGATAGSWGAMYQALQALIDANSQNTHSGDVVSISMGAPEGFLSQDVFSAINQQLRIITQALHMTVFVSSGDCGAFSDGAYNGKPDVQFPASSPWVVSVGGTRMAFSGKGFDEKVWSDRSNLAKCQNAWGSGGGVSKAFPRPQFQTGSGTENQYTTGYRQLPDVSAAAINLPVLFQGRWLAFGGTSAAAPIWAAGMSLMNQGLIAKTRGFYYGPDTLYFVANHPAQGKKPFHDVVAGDNLYYQATPGWDNASGWGSPAWPDIFGTLLTAPES